MQISRTASRSIPGSSGDVGAGEALTGTDLIAAVRGHLVRGLMLAFALGAGASLAGLLLPLYGMNLFNLVLTTLNTNTMAWLSLLLAIGVIVYGALEYARSLLYGALAESVNARLAIPALLAAARAADATTPSRSGQAIRDLGEIRGFIAGNAVTVPLELVWTPVMIGVLFVMHWGYGAFALVCALLLAGLGLLADMLTRRPLQDANELTVRAFAEVSTAIRHAEAVTALGMLPALARRWRRSQDRMLDQLWRGTRIGRAIAAATRALRLSMTGGMVCLGLVLAIQGEVSAGSLIAANIILARLLQPFESLVASWRGWVSAAAAWGRLRGLIADTRGSRGILPLPCRVGRVTVERLVYVAPGSERPVLRGISFEIEPGQVLGVVGPSGAGKSTLARVVVGVAQPSGGGVWLDGNSTWSWERGDFGRHAGYMPQAAVLLEGTVADNIARFRDASESTIVAAAKCVGLHDAIMRLPNGYATPVGESGFLLSGGQRQRLTLARALFGDPKLIVLDEPNSSLDADGERLLLAAIDGARRAGAAILLITHRPSLVAAADKLLVLKDGMIDRFGAREGVLQALQSPPVQRLRAPSAANRPRLAAS